MRRDASLVNTPAYSTPNPRHRERPLEAADAWAKKNSGWRNYRVLLLCALMFALVVVRLLTL